MNIVFLITTYNRPKSFFELLEHLDGDVYVVDDGSTEVYNWPKMFRDKETFIAIKPHGGKKYYYHTVNELFKAVEKKYDYYFMIPDDFIPVKGFVEKAITVWNNINNPGKIALNLYASEGRLGVAQWTNITPVEYEDHFLTGWVDMCFMCETRFFKELGHIPRINLNWNLRPELSSGVGAAISKILAYKGFGIYQVKKSLFTPHEEAFDSKMNAWRDKGDPINIPVI